LSVQYAGTLSDFLQACGVKSGLELTVRPLSNGRTQRYELRPPFAIVGRHSRCDIVLPDWLVSTRHVYLQAIDGALFCVDLGTRMGLHWRSGRRGTGWWQTGDALYAGQYELELAGASAKWAVPSPEARPSPMRRPRNDEGLPEVWLEFLNTGGTDRVWRMSRKLVLAGRAPWCKLQLDHRSVSQAHCALLWLRDALWFVDLASRSGVCVNNMPQRWGVVPPGGVLEVGVFRIRCHYEPPSQLVTQGVGSIDQQDGAGAVERNETDEGEEAGPERDEEGEPLAERTGEGGAMRAVAPVSELGAPEITPDRGQPDQTVAPPAAPSSTVPASHVEWMLDQLSRMQQQTFDQFQQLILVVLHTFSRMHQEQSELLARELEALASVNKEIVWLRTRLAAGGVAASPEGTGADAEDAQKRPSQATVRVTVAPGGPGRKKQTETQRKTRRPAPQAQVRAAATPAEERAANAGKAVGKLAAAGGNGEAAANENVHAWLCRRMAELEREQQTRWQRILSILTGGLTKTDRLP